MNDEYSVYISKITDIKQNLRDSFEFVNWKKHVKKDSDVFIKPNFTYPYYKAGITTSPDFIKPLLEILKDRAQNVYVGESNGANHSFKAIDAFKGHGMYDICKETGVELVSLSEIPSVNIEDSIHGKKVKVQLPKLLVDEINCFISAPVLKVHAMTRVTLSMKNLWGCHPNTMRCLEHKNLSEKLTLITKTLNPKLIAMDASYALDNHGPMYGEPKKLDLILSSNNPVAIDSLCTALMGISLSEVDHINVAEKEGLGVTDLNKININDNWQKYKMQFNSNRTIIDYLSLLLFKSEIIPKIVMDSPATPLIYGIAKFLRNSDENKVANEMKGYKK